MKTAQHWKRGQEHHQDIIKGQVGISGRWHYWLLHLSTILPFSDFYFKIIFLVLLVRRIICLLVIQLPKFYDFVYYFSITLCFIPLNLPFRHFYAVVNDKFKQNLNHNFYQEATETCSKKVVMMALSIYFSSYCIS